jgi:predicted DNA-binding transcriptional regulator AlpA
MQSSNKKPTQVDIAKKAMAMKAATQAEKLPVEPPPVRLLDKSDILAITGVTFPTVWSWMRAGQFPRSRVVGGKSMWLSTEVEDWLVKLPVRPLKGDVPLPDEATAADALAAKRAS